MLIGLDIGGTKIAAGLADEQGKILKKIVVPTCQSKNAKESLAQLLSIIEELASTAPKKASFKIGIAIPGQADAKGKIFNIPNIPALKGINLAQELKKHFKANYSIENDANAAAVAELVFGAGQKLNNFIYLTISTGIGSGIIINNQLYKGSTGSAGEAGHMMLFPNGPLCGCGNYGCWETLGSGTALANMAKAKILNKENTLLNEMTNYDLNKITAKLVFTAAEQNDPLALNLVKVNTFYNAMGIANLTNLLDPEAIIIGGGVSFSGKIFFDNLKYYLTFFKKLNPSNSIKILKAGCKKDSGLLGALALAKKICK